MKLHTIAAATAAFVLATGAYAGSLSVIGSGAKAPSITSATAKGTVLYDQTADDAGYGSISQNFWSSFDAFDNAAADDFVVPTGETWTVSQIFIPGHYFSGTGPVSSLHIEIYANKNGNVGASLFAADIVPKDDGTGSFTVNLPKKAVKLKAGTYWLSAVVNMDFAVGGIWGWSNSNSIVGLPFKWQNPGDGFTSGCTTWTDFSNCLGGSSHGDHRFQIIGSKK